LSPSGNHEFTFIMKVRPGSRQAALDLDNEPGGSHASPRGRQAGLVPLPGTAGAPLTPEQKRFRKLSAQVEAARESLERFEQQAREFTQRQTELTRPLVAELVSCGEVLLRAMEAFHGAQKLAPAQRRTLRRSITEQAAELIDLMDGPPPAWLVEIHDRHARKTHAQQVAEDKLSMQTMLGEALGEDLGDELLSDEELTAKLAQMMAEEARRKQGAEAADAAPVNDATSERGPQARSHPGAEGRATGTGTGAGAARGPRSRATAQAQRQAAEALQFTQSVREVFRRLASALHPDRVPEGPERDAMTALMQQVNQAYEAKDLLKLLDLQARLDSHATGNAEQRAMGLSAATLRHYNQLLRQELDDLRTALLIEEEQLLDAHPHVAHFLMGRTNGKTRAEVLAKAGQHELRLLQRQIEEAQASLKALSNGASGRRWLAGQRQQQREADEDSELDQFLTSLLDDGPPGVGPGGFDDADDGNPFASPRRRRRGGPPDDLPF
jgi:hypothetical protein